MTELIKMKNMKKKGKEKWSKKKSAKQTPKK